MFNLRSTSTRASRKSSAFLNAPVLLALLAWLAPAVDVHLPAAVSRRVSTGKNARFANVSILISGQRFRRAMTATVPLSHKVSPPYGTCS